MIAEIISIGDELLNGTKLNTNANWLADRLLRLGIQISWISTIGDDKESIKMALSQSKVRSQIVLLTGGLGPTHDDITKECVAEFYQIDLVRDESIERHIINLFAKRGKPMPEINLQQAMVPKGATVLSNEIGTAPGIYFDQEGIHCFVLPGVPAEMRKMTEDSVIPILKEQFGGLRSTVRYETIRTTDIFESKLVEKLGPIEDVEKYGKLAVLPHPYGVDLRLCVTGKEISDSKLKIDQAIELIRERIDPYIYEIGSRSLEEVIAEQLVEKGRTVAVAESCTGGLLANLFTNIPGSSAYFLGGVIAYDNSVKTNLLGIKNSVIEEYGAVSEVVAREMAIGMQNLVNSDFVLATTGIAGPTGETEDKQVGLVYIAIVEGDDVIVKKFVFHRSRLINKSRFAYAALNLLRKRLLDA